MIGHDLSNNVCEYEVNRLTNEKEENETLSISRNFLRIIRLMNNKSLSFRERTQFIQ